MDKGKILLVDDDPAVCQLLCAPLRAHGYEAVASDDGAEAWNSLQDGGFELAIVDLNLPNLDGLQLIRTARRLDPEIEVIILIGHGDVEPAVAALSLGAYDYYRKPVQDLTQFGNVVERALERRRLRQANRDLIVQLRAAKQQLEQQRASELERVEQIGRALTSNLHREQIVELLQQALLTNDEYGGEAIALLTWNAQGEFGNLSIRSRHYLEPAVLLDLRERMLTLAVEAGAPDKNEALFETNVRASDQFRAQKPLATPLLGDDSIGLPVQGQTMGVLAIFSQQPNALSAECHRVFRILGQQAATALDSIALFEQVRELARRDGLTQLFNHLYFMDLLENEVRRSRRYRRAVSLLFIDIDHFKQVNDSYGHPIGDQVLIRLARLLESNVRDTDLLGRYGGEEFVVLLTESARHEAMALAERLRGLVETQTFQINGARVQITLSVGISAYPPERVGTADELIHAADAALLQAKATGRNRVCVQAISR